MSIVLYPALPPTAPRLAAQCRIPASDSWMWLRVSQSSYVWYRASSESKTLYQGTRASLQHSTHAGSLDKKQTLPGRRLSCHIIQCRRTGRKGWDRKTSHSHIVGIQSFTCQVILRGLYMAPSATCKCAG